MTSINSVVSSVLNDYYSINTSTTTTTANTIATDTTTVSSSTSAAKDTSLVGQYIDDTSSSKLDAKTIFKELSIDMGGDGKTITKDQLDSYVSDAESGNLSISNDELKSLKTLQSSWKTVSEGGDSITYANVSGDKGLFTSMAGTTATTSSTSDINLTQSSTDQIYSYLINSALSSNSQTASSTDLSSMLKTLLSGTTDENDDANANAIATLTNLIAQSKSTSTIVVEG